MEKNLAALQPENLVFRKDAGQCLAGRTIVFGVQEREDDAAVREDIVHIRTRQSTFAPFEIVQKPRWKGSGLLVGRVEGARVMQWSSRRDGTQDYDGDLAVRA